MAGPTNSVVDVKIRIGAEGQDVLVQVNKGLGEIETTAKKASGGVRELTGASADLNPKLADTEKNTNQAAKGADTMSRSFGGLPTILSLIAGVLLTLGIAQLATDCILAAARVETLQVSLHKVGANLGYTNSQMDGYVAAVQKSGISSLEARASVLRLAEANIDLTKSAQLARAAQDAAVIANTTSADALERISTGIATGQSILLHHLGLMTNFEGAYITAAHAVGKTSTELTEAEKSTIRLNETLRAAHGIAGTYEAAMGTAGKQINSFNRYIRDFQVELGKAFGPALTELVGMATQRMGQLTDLVKSSPVQSVLQGIGSAVVLVANNLGTLAAILAVAGAAWLAYQVQLAAATIATTAAQLASMGLSGALAGTLISAIYAVGYAWVQLTAWLAANPLVALTLVIGAAVVAYTALTKSTSDYLREAQKGTQELADASRAYASAKSEVTSLDGALRKFDEAIKLAHGDHRLELAAVQDLAGRYPQLVGTYTTVGEALANINAKRQDYLALLEREAQMKEMELKEKARQKINEVGGALRVLTQDVRNYQAGLDGSPLDRWAAGFVDINTTAKGLIVTLDEVRTANAINPSNAEEGQKLARVIEDLLLQLNRVKGIAPEVQKALESALKPRLTDKISEMIRQAGPISDDADLVGEMGSRRPLPKKTAEHLASEWQKTHDEALRIGKAPSEAARLAAQEEYKSYSDEFKRLYPGVAENIRALKLAEAGKTAVAEQTAHAKSQHEIGALSTQALMESLRARQAVLAHGNIVERTEAARLQKEITGLELKESENRIAAAEREFQQKMKGDEIATRRFQKELEAVQRSTLPYEQKAALIASLEEQITAVQISNRAKATAQMEEVYNRERTLIQNSTLGQEEKAAKLIALDNKVQQNRLALAAAQEKLEEARIKAAEEWAKVESEVTKTLLADKARAIYELQIRYEKYYLALEEHARREGKDAEWLAQRKLWVQTAYLKEYELLNLSTLGKLLRAWTDNDKLMVDSTAEALKSIQSGWTNLLTRVLKGEIKTFDDFWKGFLDMMVNAWANMLAQLAAAWTMSGIAKIIAGLFDINLGSTSISLGLGGGGGLLGTVSSGISLVKGASTVGGWLGLGAPAVTAAGLGGDIYAGIATQVAEMYAAEQSGAASYLIAESGAVAPGSTGVWAGIKSAFDSAVSAVKGLVSGAEAATAATETAVAATEASTAAAEAATIATEAGTVATEAATATTMGLSTGLAWVGGALAVGEIMAKLTGGVGPVGAVMELVTGEKHSMTKAQAQQNIADYMGMLHNYDDYVQGRGPGAEVGNTAENLNNIFRMSDRAGFSPEQVKEMLKGYSSAALAKMMESWQGSQVFNNMTLEMEKRDTANDPFTKVLAQAKTEAGYIEGLAQKFALTNKQASLLATGMYKLESAIEEASRAGNKELAVALMKDLAGLHRVQEQTGLTDEQMQAIPESMGAVVRASDQMGAKISAAMTQAREQFGYLDEQLGGLGGEMSNQAAAMGASMSQLADSLGLPRESTEALKLKTNELISQWGQGALTAEDLALKLQNEFVAALQSASLAGYELIGALEAIPNVDRTVNIHFQYLGEGEMPTAPGPGEGYSDPAGPPGEQHHHGGWAGDGLAPRRFHGGGWPGLRQDEIPAILQRGEPVFSLDEVERLGGPGVIESLRKGLLPVIQAPAGGQGGTNIERMETHVHVAGDVVGEAGALDRVKAAATKGVLAALAKKQAAGDDPRVKHQLRPRV